MRPSMDPRVRGAAEAACAEWLLMKEGLEFQGQPASVMPELSFDALVKRTEVYFEILRAFTEKRNNNALLSLIGDLRHMFAQGQSVTRAQVSSMARGLLLSSLLL